MRLGITLKEIFRVLQKQWIMYACGKIFMRQGLLLGHLLCDRAQSAERFPHNSEAKEKLVKPRKNNLCLVLSGINGRTSLKG